MAQNDGDHKALSVVADGGGRLSLDACLELLANRQRRTVLDYFMNSADNHATVDEIVSHIIREEEQATGERPGRDSIETALFHIHLPKFADVGVLDCDSQRLEIRYYESDRIEKIYSKLQELE